MVPTDSLDRRREKESVHCPRHHTSLGRATPPPAHDDIEDIAIAPKRKSTVERVSKP